MRPVVGLHDGTHDGYMIEPVLGTQFNLSACCHMVRYCLERRKPYLQKCMGWRYTGAKGKRGGLNNDWPCINSS